MGVDQATEAMNLILLDEMDVTGGVARLGDDRARHIREVLKLRVGDRLRVGRLNGPLGTGCIARIDADEVTLHCTWEDSTPRPPVDLLLAMPRPKVMRRLWAQLAAMGVRRIFLTHAEKVERYYFDSHVLQPEKVDTLLREGLQQARDTHMPQVEIHRQLKPLLEDHLRDYAVKLVSHPGAADAIQSRQPRKQTLLALGPEGGWSDSEVDLFQANDFHPVGLGPRVLRSDTACIAALALLHDAIAETLNAEPRPRALR
jgi:RsmE family RNA methyltransferase